MTTMDKVPMTMEGYRKLEAELHRLKSQERPRIIQQIADAREHGDLSENAEYHAAKDAQGLNEAKVAFVPGEAFGAPGYARLSFALGDEDLVRGVQRIHDLLA